MKISILITDGKAINIDVEKEAFINDKNVVTVGKNDITDIFNNIVVNHL